MKRTAFVFLVLFLSLSSVFAFPTSQVGRAAYDGPCPKYIFYFIGDGFGVAQAEAAEAFLSAEKGGAGVELLAMDTLPIYGMASTYAADRFVTDSAAAGTALATGNG